MENPLITGIRTAIEPKIGNDPAPGRSPRLLSPILFPIGRQPGTPAQQHADQPDLRGPGLPQPDTAAAPYRRLCVRSHGHRG